ncbi:alpha/beta hydrolase [Collimonas antrihumi]|uniref:alpha/beta hydrolase n=1 Tax=Collimonas antrihumi TaxID=1940615 RepID=UPI001B8BFE86|nr:alpha/beta hydrolase [Collimonas antrihumi]
MTIDPQAQAILSMFAAIPQPDFATLQASDYRAMIAQQKLPPSNELVAQIADRVITGPGGPLALRLYHPKPGATLPAILFFHGGGWVDGDLESHDNLCRRLANLSGCAVIAVDYRLAPDAPFPAALDDARAALQWLHAHAGECQIDPHRLAVCGDSAGGNLAIACTLMARDPAQNLPRISHQLLFYPVIDAACDTPSFDSYASGYLLTRDMMQWFWRQYLKHPADRQNGHAVPAQAVDLAGLPSATIITAQCDPLADEGAAYAKRLQHAGVPVEFKCWDGVFHGFASMTGMMQAADDALVLGANAVSRALGHQD